MRVELPVADDGYQGHLALIAEAQAGGTMPGGDYGSDLTINTPMYVNGNLKMSGATLTLVGNGVLYVNGVFEPKSGATLINDGIVAASGKVRFSGGAAYQISATATQTLIVSFAFHEKALELSGGSEGLSQGVVYAPNRGIRLSGGSDWQGAVVAGGSSGLGKIDISGGYQNGLLSGSVVLPGAATPPPTTETIALVSRREL